MELLSLVKLLDIETYLLSISFFFYPFRVLVPVSSSRLAPFWHT